MLCSKCQTENLENAKYCKACGQELQHSLPEKVEESTQKSRRKQIIIGGIILLAAILFCIGALVVHSSQKEKNYKGTIQSAGRYLEKMDYERAEAKYLEAAKIDPKKEEPYLQLADIYMEQGNPEKAIEILEQGKANTNGSSRIDQKLDEIQKKNEPSASVQDAESEQEADCVSFLEETLIPQEGLADLGIFPDDGSNNLGIVGAWIHDINGDGQEEILTARSSVHGGSDLDITLYGAADGEILPLGEREPEESAEAVSGSDSSHEVFIKEFDGVYYLAVFRTGASQGYSVSGETLMLYTLGEGIEECCRISTDFYRGSGRLIMNEEEIYSLADEDYMSFSEEEVHAMREEAVGKVKDVLASYGLEEKIQIGDPQEVGLGSLLLLSGYDSEDESETGLCRSERTQTGDYTPEGEPEMQVMVEDFTDLRTLLEEEE